MTTKTDAIIMSSPCLKTMLSVITDNNLLRHEKKKIDDIEDASFENTLCTIRDLATVSKYAYAMQKKYQFSRHLIKAIKLTTKCRTRELLVGILANLACHEEVGQKLMKSDDVLLLCRSLLRDKNQTELLLEITKLLNTFFTYATSFSSSCSTFISKEVERRKQQQQQSPKIPLPTIINYDHLNLFLVHNDRLQLSIYHQYTQIIMNTSNSELLYTSLQLLTSITIYIYNVTVLSSLLPLSSPSSSPPPMCHNEDQNEKMDKKKLINWAIERLKKETKDIETEKRLNNAIVKPILCLVWTFLFYGLSDNPSQYTSNLDSSLSIITHHLQQQTESDKTSDDRDIEIIINALHDI